MKVIDTVFVGRKTYYKNVYETIIKNYCYNLLYLLSKVDAKLCDKTYFI